MILLHIEHAVPDFDAWRAAFENDPIGRQKMGVRCYRVLRPTDNPNFAIIDLEFNNSHEAVALLAAMQQVWSRVGGKLIKDPQWRISEVVDSKAY